MATAKKKAAPKNSTGKDQPVRAGRKATQGTSGASAMRESQARTDKIRGMIDKSVQRGKSQSGDLGGPNSGQLKGFDYGSPIFQRSRTEQRQMDQTKRKAASMGKTAASKVSNAKKVAKGKK